jgi:hypothetical protein
MRQNQKYEKRHEEFQFPNPMKMNEFEKHQVMLEKMERDAARRKYIRGIQGVDGGDCYGYDEENYSY